MIDLKEITESLAQDRTKKNVSRIVSAMETIGVDLNEYLDEVESASFPLQWYLTWTLGHFLENNSSVDSSVQRRLWRLTQSNNNHSIDRDYWRIWSFINIDEEIAGEIYESAIKNIMSSKAALAVRAHSMQSAYRIAQPYPELRTELLNILEGLEQDDAPAICSRSRNLSKKLRKSLQIKE